MCNSVYLGQLLYFIFGKLWEVESFVCFAEIIGWASESPEFLHGEHGLLLQSSSLSSLPLLDNIIEKTKITTQLQVVCNPSLSHWPGGLSIKEGRQGVGGHGWFCFDWRGR